MQTIEAEIRSFLSDEEYARLFEYFKAQGKLLKEDEQETHYFDCTEDIRIQKNKYFSKIWMKKGKLHDDAREEIEVQCKKEDFEKLQKIFASLHLKVKIKWFRKRFEFEWEGVTATLDDTKGYGKIIELEKMCSEEEKEATIILLQQKLKELGIKLTPKEEFAEKFAHYEKNWRELV